MVSFSAINALLRRPFVTLARGGQTSAAAGLVDALVDLRLTHLELLAPAQEIVDHRAGDAHPTVVSPDRRRRRAGADAPGAGRVVLTTAAARPHGARRVNAQEQADAVVAQQPHRAAAVPRTRIDGIAQVGGRD